MSLRSPLSKAVGLGSAKHGFSHWWWQRHGTVANWLSSPINATITLLFALTSIYHGQTGLQVVIEDYVHTKWLNLVLLLSMKFASVVMAVLAIISVFKVALTAAVGG